MARSAFRRSFWGSPPSLGYEAHANARGHEELSTGNHERRLQLLLLFRNWNEAGAAFDFDNRDEFVATQTRQRVVVPERASKPVPGTTQHVVAGLMSERIVDLLEMIDVDEEQSRDVSLAMCA